MFPIEAGTEWHVTLLAWTQRGQARSPRTKSPARSSKWQMKQLGTPRPMGSHTVRRCGVISANIGWGPHGAGQPDGTAGQSADVGYTESAGEAMGIGIQP